MTALIPHLYFDGECEAAFNFYREVFGAQMQGPMRWGDNPMCEQFTDEDKKKVMHVSLDLGGAGLMGNDFVPAMAGQQYVPGNNFAVSIIPDTREEADRLFARLSEGGKAVMPMQDMFWGGYFGALADQFGISWMLNVDTRS
jgi:PhnB protein